MALNIFRQKTQVRKSDTYDDTLAAGQTTLETNSTDLETDENAVRSQIRRILSTLSGNWYDDIATFNLKQRGIKELNEDLNTLEIITDIRDLFTPTNGQTVFTLTQIPLNPTDVQVFINGQKLQTGRDFSISGTILTILLTDYLLSTNDNLEIYYQYLT